MPCDLLFGSLAHKDVWRYLPLLAANAGRVILTTPVNSKALPPSELRSIIADQAKVVIEDDVGVALQRAIAEVVEPCDRAPLLVVCGSIYLVGDVRTRLREEFGEPPSAGSMALFDHPRQSSE